jgi:dUTPase
VNVNQPVYSLREERDAAGVLRSVTLEKSDAAVRLSRGDKIIQMTPLRAWTEWPVRVVESLRESQRAARGFGSTGR